MLKKAVLACCIAVSVSACNQEISGTLYVRDIQEALETKKEIPVDINIDIYETGIAKQCSDPKGQKIVEAIAKQFAGASLGGCEVIQGSMNDRMTIKASTAIIAPESTKVVPSKYLLNFDVHKGQQNDEAFVVARFNPDKYAELQKAVSDVNMMANIKLSDVGINMKVNNDTRNAVAVLPPSGLYVDNDPIDASTNAVSLEPRKEMFMKFGDVKLAFLAKYQWAVVTTVFFDGNKSADNEKKTD